MSNEPLVELGEVVDLLTGFPFKSSDYTSAPSGTRLLRGDNIGQGKLRWDGVKRWPSRLVPNVERYSLAAGDVVLAMDRPWIDAGLKYACVGSDDVPCLLVQRVARLRGTHRLDTGYLKYVVGSRSFTDHVLAVQTGTAVPHISGDQIKTFRFPLPPVAIQRAITSVLGALDDKIDLNRRMNETLEAMARAIFKDWFVDFGPTRAKMEGRAPYLSPDVWSLFPDRLDDEGKPEGWGYGPLSSCADIIMGASPDGTTYNTIGVGTPLVNGPVEYGDFFLRRIKWTTAPSKLSERGDFIICVRGSTTGRHAFADGAYCLGRGVAAIRAHNMHQPFVNYLLLMKIDELLQKTTGSVFPSLSSNDIRDFQILTATKPVRQWFTDITGIYEQLIWRNVEQNDTLAATRDLLLPKLMSGEIRIKDAEREVANAL